MRSLSQYKPEVAAQCTLINFIATERGLEDQLLAKVVGVERPDLEAETQRLTDEACKFKLQLHELENELLERLANAPEDILSDVPLIEGLESTKRTSKEIEQALDLGRKARESINIAREAYRKAASEGLIAVSLRVCDTCVECLHQVQCYTFFLRNFA